MEIRNKKDGKRIGISDRAVALADVVSAFFSQKGEELTTKKISKISGRSSEVVYQKCRELEELGIIKSALNDSELRLGYHPKYGYLTEEVVNKLKLQMKHEGLTEDEIALKLTEVYLECLYWLIPKARYWWLKKDWELER
jgi:hypothetical protein